MPETESLEYLQAELSQQIGGFNRSRRFFRSTYFYFTLSTAGLSAVTTMLIGASHMVPDPLWWLPLAALVCSAITTVLAAYEGFLRSRDLWVQKTDAWMALQVLNEHVKYAKAKSVTPLAQSQIDDFQCALRTNTDGRTRSVEGFAKRSHWSHSWTAKAGKPLWTAIPG